MNLNHEIHELTSAINRMKPTEPQIKELHGCYLRMTGTEEKVIPLSLGRMFHWEQFIRAGYNEDDLRLVIEVLRRKIKTGPNTFSCLKFSNLIADIEKFQEALSEAKALSRLPVVDKGRESVLKATHRPPGAKDSPPRSAADVLKGHEEFKKFCALKDTL